MLGRRLSVVLAAALALGVAAMALAQSGTPTTGGNSAHLTDLQAEEEAIRAESEQLGGSRSPATSVNNVQSRINSVQSDIDRLSEVATQLGATADELKALEQEVGDRPIFELGSDGAQQAGQEAAQKALAKVCSEEVTHAVWWAAIVGDVVEYGGKWFIRRLNVSEIRDLVRDQRMRLSDLYGVISKLQCQQSQDRATLRRLQELRARDNAVFREIAEERQRIRQQGRPARSRAVLTRETDAAGDEQLRRQQLEDGVRLAQPAGPSHASSNLTPFQREILAAHNGERAAVGAAALVWNPVLAQHAQDRAVQLAEIGRLEHAPREGRGIERENLERALVGWMPTQMVQDWFDEKRYFVPGTYPMVCTGEWTLCAHYTQVIWPETTDLGCGVATGQGYQWLVCRYSPGGNRDGHLVGARPSLPHPPALPPPPPPPP